MEKISHRITLDVHKGGIQKVLHGMFTGDVLSRKIVISLVAGSAVCNMDENTAAVMYVTKPSGVTNYGACTVEGNLVTYDILPADIDEPGITQMQLKVISGEMVLYAPMFSVEAQKNSSSDTPAETSPQFSALEQALAQVEEVYNKRIVSVEVEEDYTFVVTYADGETYTSDAFKALMEEIEKAEHERAEAEVARDVAEENRKLAESARASSYADMKNDIQGAIDANTALYNRVEDLADEGLITESRVIEIIEEQGGGGGGGTVVLPDNVLVASDVSAAEVNPPKINADLFGSLTPADYAKTTDVNAIKNGTTKVGNAETLDGHGAEYFAPLSRINSKMLTTSILEKALTSPDGISEYKIAGGSYTANDLPSSYWNYGSAIVIKRSGVSIVVILVSEQFGKLAINRYDGQKWYGWDLNATTADLANYLPLTGGTVKTSGNTTITNESTSVDMVLNRYVGKSGALGYLGFNGIGNPCYVDNGGDTKTILHTGNKTTGTYTGNGSATQRTISIGGIGRALKIVSTNGGGIVDSQGGIFWYNGQSKTFPPSQLNFSSGVLTVATTDSYVNYNGSNYYWDLL